MMNRSFTLFLVLLACGVGNVRGASAELPETIKAPAGAKLLFTAEGKGVQIYKSGSENGALIWKFEAPRAELSGARGREIWKHYAGPAWEAADGSVVRKSDEKDAVAQVSAPNPKEDVPWLLIKVKTHGDKVGVLSGMRFVQRINTHGGQPPALPPTQIDTRVEVEYTAVYNFYSAVE